MLKTGKFGICCVLLLALFLGGCGYYFPHVYNGPSRVIYMPNWKNRTNKLGLDIKIYQELSRWFQKSESIELTKDKGSADLILAGEIVSITLPSVSWESASSANYYKVKLIVRYVLKDLRSGKIMWEVPKKLYTEDYSGTSASTTEEDKALETIIEDMSESIYLGTLNRLRRQQAQPEGSAEQNTVDVKN